MLHIGQATDAALRTLYYNAYNVAMVTSVGGVFAYSNIDAAKTYYRAGLIILPYASRNYHEL